MLILLNMIIAVMSLTFEQVSEENKAYIYREKLVLLMSKDFLIRQAAEDLVKTKYLVAFDVDPETNDHEDVIAEIHNSISMLK